MSILTLLYRVIYNLLTTAHIHYQSYTKVIDISIGMAKLVILFGLMGIILSKNLPKIISIVDRVVDIPYKGYEG